MSKRWYVIYTQSGFEQKIEGLLRKRAQLEGLEDCIGDIFVPTENVSEVKDGKKRITTRKFFPGYVLINMEMTDSAWHLVRQTVGISGFVSAAQKPLAITEEEVKRIVLQTEEKKDKLQPKVSFESGESIKIVEGPFLSFSGLIEEVYPDKGKIRVMVSIFGRSTPVELEYWQVEKI